MRALRLVRFELTVADLEAATRFYAALPGVAVAGRGTADPALAALLGAESIEQVELRRGDQVILLQAFTPPGAPYPADPSSADQAFQHLALPVADAVDAAGRLPREAVPISRGGAQHLPPSSGGAVAYKFRDPEAHPLELIQFADGHLGGVDHSAVVAADVERSIAFYRDQIGLTVAARQTNRGPEQDRLDGLDDDVVDVVALSPETETPHIELLAYRSPAVRPSPPRAPADVAATRLVLAVDRLVDATTRLADGTPASLLPDPDGHLLLLLEQPAPP